MRPRLHDLTVYSIQIAMTEMWKRKEGVPSMDLTEMPGKPVLGMGTCT